MKEPSPPDHELTPAEIVAALDQHIVGQEDAKRAVAIAIRNRWRRRQLPEVMRDEVMPKNIILIGSTGVGKTEIARRVSSLVRAPLLKVEASKYTEVGYHGRDVESMVRDLVEIAVSLVKAEELEQVEKKAEELVEGRILDLLAPPASDFGDEEERQKREHTRDSLRRKLNAGQLETREVEITIDSTSMPFVEVLSNSGVEQFGLDLQGMFSKFGPRSTQTKRVPISEARGLLKDQEAEKLVDQERVHQEGVRRAEDSGIIFLDEIDKIISSGEHGPEVSRGGVQRDLLPIVEGSTVMTRYGVMHTDHVLFIGAGAFHGSRPSDLIPELQGRFPIRVELSTLGKEEFLRILEEPRNSLPRQYKALLSTEGVEVTFTPDALRRIAELAYELNQNTQDIGARRLYTLFEKLLEGPLFGAPDRLPEGGRRVSVDTAYVEERLAEIVADQEQSGYIL